MNNTQHNNSIETLVTERLVLRALEENDAKALLNTPYASNEAEALRDMLMGIGTM